MQYPVPLPMHNDHNGPYEVSETCVHNKICDCTCRCFCFVYYELRFSGSDNLIKNLTYLLASEVFNTDIKHIIIGKVFRDINTFYKNFWFNPDIENKEIFAVFASFKRDNWSFSNWSEDYYNEENLQSP